MVLLAVESEQELQEWANKIKQLDIPFSGFIEPDIGDQLTSVACLPLDGSIFKGLKTLKFP